MAKNFTLTAGGDDLSSAAEYGRVFNQADVIQRRTTTRTGLAAQGEELADVGEKQIG